MNPKRVIILILVFLSLNCSLQKTTDGGYTNKPQNDESTIYLLNKSFEDNPMKSDKYRNLTFMGMKTTFGPPKFWTNCEDFKSIYTLDGNHSKYDKVSIRAYEGDFYTGIAINRNGTRGILAQELPLELIANKKYQIELFVAFAKTYLHWNENPPVNNSDNEPGKLELWGSNDGCELEELLFESDVVNNSQWKRLSINFSPTENFRFIAFTLGNVDKEQESSNSNILIDEISNIKIIK